MKLKNRSKSHLSRSSKNFNPTRIKMRKQHLMRKRKVKKLWQKRRVRLRKTNKKQLQWKKMNKKKKLMIMSSSRQRL